MGDLNTELIKELSKCVKCGACLSVCPTYKELVEEPFSPRGRAALAEEVGHGNLEFSGRLIEVFNKCVGCESCEAVCTKGVPVTKIIYEIRELLYEKKQYDKVIHSAIRLMYSSPSLFAMLMKNASILRPLLFEDIKGLDLIKPRITLPFLDKSRFFPKMRAKPFLNRDHSSATKSKHHISLFVGCVFNHISPNIADDSFNILKMLGDDVHVCAEQICCGAPAMGIGDMHGVKEVVMKNIDRLTASRPEKIVSICASCTLMLKKYYPIIFDDEGDTIKEKVRKFSAKVVDIAVYLKNNKERLDKVLKIKNDTEITYHLPCHLSKGLKSGNIYKEIFDESKNIKLIDPENPDACCGYGGVFNYKHSELAMKICERRVKGLVESGAKTVITSCSGCIMQLKEGLHRYGSDMKVTHICEFIRANS